MSPSQRRGEGGGATGGARLGSGLASCPNGGICVFPSFVPNSRGDGAVATLRRGVHAPEPEEAHRGEAGSVRATVPAPSTRGQPRSLEQDPRSRTPGAGPLPQPWAAGPLAPGSPRSARSLPASFAEPRAHHRTPRIIRRPLSMHWEPLPTYQCAGKRPPQLSHRRGGIFSCPPGPGRGSRKRRPRRVAPAGARPSPSLPHHPRPVGRNPGLSGLCPGGARRTALGQPVPPREGRWLTVTGTILVKMPQLVLLFHPQESPRGSRDTGSIRILGAPAGCDPTGLGRSCHRSPAPSCWPHV